MLRTARWFTPLLLLAASTPLLGQKPSRVGFSAEASVVYVTVNGDDLKDTDAGVGFDVAGVLRFPSAWALAAGVQRTSHDDSELGVDVGVLQIYAEPRWMISTKNAAASPYLFGRVALVKASADNTSFGDFSSDGWSFGGGAGVLLGAGTVKFHASAGFHALSFGDAEVDGQTIPDSDASGSTITLRGGVSIRFGSGASASRATPRR